MPRKARQKSSTKVYHVILRGNAKQDIFLEKQDYNKFMKEMERTKEKYQYELYAYCLMTNHVHLVLYDKMDQLSKLLQSLMISYSSYWNKKNERVGHLFQNRFLSKSVETESYLKTVCRYIHQNPEKSGMAKIQEYPWSSYQEYVGKEKLIDKAQVLDLFASNEKEAIDNFITFHKINQNRIEDFAEYEMVEKLNDEQAKDYIKEILKLDNIQEIAKYDLEKRNQCIKKLENRQGISNLQIARVTGLTKRMVEVAMK